MAIKFVPTFITEDGKSYDTLDKAVIHERRRLVQHLLLDKRSELHLSLADIDKAAAIICAVQGPVAEVFATNMTGDMDISAAKQFAPVEKRTEPPVETKNVFEARPRADSRPIVPPVVHSDIRSGIEAKDALNSPLHPGDAVRLLSTAGELDKENWGDAMYRVVEEVGDNNEVRIGYTIWNSRMLMKKRAEPVQASA